MGSANNKSTDIKKDIKNISSKYIEKTLTKILLTIKNNCKVNNSNIIIVKTEGVLSIGKTGSINQTMNANVKCIVGVDTQKLLSKEGKASLKQELEGGLKNLAAAYSTSLASFGNTSTTISETSTFIDNAFENHTETLSEQDIQNEVSVANYNVMNLYAKEGISIDGEVSQENNLTIETIVKIADSISSEIVNSLDIDTAVKTKSETEQAKSATDVVTEGVNTAIKDTAGEFIKGFSNMSMVIIAVVGIVLVLFGKDIIGGFLGTQSSASHLPYSNPLLQPNNNYMPPPLPPPMYPVNNYPFSQPNYHNNSSIFPQPNNNFVPSNNITSQVDVFNPPTENVNNPLGRNLPPTNSNNSPSSVNIFSLPSENVNNPLGRNLSVQS